MTIKSILPVLLIFLAFECSAQINNTPSADTTRIYRIETIDDNEFIGRIVANESGKVIFNTDKFGTITINMTDIRSIEEIDPKSIVGNTYWPDNFQSTRYFWMPNGFGLKPGEAYYQNVWILFNQFSIGVTKNLSIGAGTIPVYLFGAPVFPFWITPKVSIPLGDKVNLGAGVLFFFVADGQDDGPNSAGVTYGVVTFGSRNRNASIGVGYGFSGKTFAKRPVITFATMNRVSRRGYFMTESYLFGAGGDDATSAAIVSLGGRVLVKKVGIDFGGFIPISREMDRFVAIPWLGVSCPLGKQHRED